MRSWTSLKFRFFVALAFEQIECAARQNRAPAREAAQPVKTKTPPKPARFSVRAAGVGGLCFEDSGLLYHLDYPARSRVN